jgi:alpha-ketoglutarate-dependent taurine dioxygenase
MTTARCGEPDLKTVNLQANFQWHIDSTFLPVPALVNILTAKIVPSSGRRDGICQHPRGLGRDARGAQGARRGARHVAQRQPVAQKINEELSNGPCSTNGRRSTGNRSGPTR